LDCKLISGQDTKRPPLTSRNKFPDIKAGQAGTGSPRRGTRKFPKYLQTEIRTIQLFLSLPGREPEGGQTSGTIVKTQHARIILYCVYFFCKAFSG
jgi:hypothetical protein